MTTQARYLLDRFQANSGRTLLVDARTGTTLTYGEVLEKSRRAARLLRDLGARLSEPIAFCADNCSELAYLYLGAMHLGARLVPVNPALHPTEVVRVLDAFKAKTLVTTPMVLSRLEMMPSVQVHCFYPAVARRKADLDRLATFELEKELAARSPDASVLADHDDESVFATVLSSGTSGAPKGVNLSYRGLIGNARAFTKRLGIGPENRFYNVLPMTYLGGLYNLLLLPIAANGSTVIDAAFGAANMYGYWETVRKHEINTLWYSPTMLSMLLSLEDDDDLSFLEKQVRIALVGMAPLPVRLKKAFEDRFRFRIFENYALSETTFLTTNHPDLVYKDGSVGKLIESVDLRIVDADRRPLPIGKDGQILVRTPFFMKGYENAVEGDLVNCLPNGEFLTGDVGHFDTDGELFVTGRIKDLIIRGGLNISPKAIEDCVYALEGIEDAAAIGMPHPVYGEEVVLAAKLKPGATLDVDAIRAHCDARLAHFQRPKLIYLLDVIPKGSTGKIQKRDIKRLLAEKHRPFEEGAS